MLVALLFLLTLADDKVITTASGLQYVEMKKGVGASPHIGETVRVNYKGWLDDGTVFDSSLESGPRDFAFTPNGLIKGWIEGLSTMKVDGRRRWKHASGTC